MDKPKLYCGHNKYTQWWTYPLLMLLVLWSGMYWVGVGFGLCDVLFRYVTRTIKTSCFVREPRFSEFWTFTIPILMSRFFCHRTDHSKLRNVLFSLCKVRCVCALWNETVFQSFTVMSRQCRGNFFSFFAPSHESCELNRLIRVCYVSLLRTAAVGLLCDLS
jgi:hypothetical protein